MPTSWGSKGWGCDGWGRDGWGVEQRKPGTQDNGGLSRPEEVRILVVDDRE